MAKLFNNRGVEYKNKGDLDRAIADYSKAIQLDPKYAKPYSGRGKAYHEKDDNDRAIADYSEAIRLDPKYAFAYNNRGIAYDKKGDLDRAIADYSEAIRLDPKYAEPYFGRGNAYYEKDDNDRAIADYSEAIRLDPDDGNALLNRGAAYNNGGKYDLAIKDFSKGLGGSLTVYGKAAAYAGLGKAHLYNGSPAEALAELSKSSELSPTSADAALWVEIAGQRNNVPSRLPQAIAPIDMTEWPAPVIRMFLGQMTPEAVLAAADDRDPSTKKDHVCDANFFGGEFLLRQGAKDEAIHRFRLAATDCANTAVERGAANAELRALSVAR